MLNNLPNDPMLCLSVVNTKLRDKYKKLDFLCDDLNVEKNELIEKRAWLSEEELCDFYCVVLVAPQGVVYGYVYIAFFVAKGGAHSGVLLYGAL